jgi:hypothetical protein
MISDYPRKRFENKIKELEFKLAELNAQKKAWEEALILLEGEKP